MTEKQQIDLITPMLRGKDSVVMHTCVEAINYGDKKWICNGDSFLCAAGFEVVYLVDYIGYFSCKFLTKL